MSNVVLVNPSNTSPGYSFITPRWLFVLAGATPAEFGDPILVDEALERFNPETIDANDIIGIGISSGNCLPGYRVLREAKKRGATVVVGGIHATIFPDEPLEMGADAVVTGNGDVVWRQVVRDALDRKLKRRYDGGRVRGEDMVKARWDLLDARRYMMPSIQTIAGCPENCSFCSVWVTEGRRPRQRLSDTVIQEANELYELGYRYIVFADDNFNPATKARIAREAGAESRAYLERLRDERLAFFEEYHRAVPPNLYAFTQMTAEIVDDEEYLSALRDKMRIRTALIGVESFSEEGLRAANKQWNPAGQKMVEAIQRIQNSGILVLASFICGLESDTAASLESLRRYASQCGAILAQFTIYCPLPGTKDYHEMMKDVVHLETPGYVRKHQSGIVRQKFWLYPGQRTDALHFAKISREELLRENKACWNAYYTLAEIMRRMRSGVGKSWPLAGKVSYFLVCLVFKRVYAEHGIAADSVQRRKSGALTKLMIKAGVTVYGAFFRKKRFSLRVRV